ncbi:MAG: porin [Saprospiraceae bacterium]|nr:porin [Saprospiraceae bacterium]MBK7699222.1 porin [Saprospiraceae bacterium]
MNTRIFTILVQIILLSGFMNTTFAQDNGALHVHNLPYYNFGKGVGITSSDSLFQFNIRFRIQNRFSYIHNEGKDDAFDGQIRRLRLRFDGYLGDPRFIYLLQLSFAPGDVGEIEEGSNLNIIRDAVGFYKINNNWNVGFGQTKLPGNRQRVNSSGALQLSDRTINNSRFNIDRDFGFFINHINEVRDKFSWNVKTSITTGDGRNFTKSPDNGLAYTAKLELLPLGKFEKDGVYFEGDLIREKTPKVMLSAAYHFNHKAKRQSGQLGDLLYESRNLKSILVDGLLKYQGFALSASYMNRNVDNPFTSNFDGDQVIVYKGQGVDVQSSYFISDKWELIGRYSVQHAHKQIAASYPDQQQYILGLTNYIWEHAFKLQFEAAYDRFKDNQTLSVKDNFYLRFQIEMGI